MFLLIGAIGFVIGLGGVLVYVNCHPAFNDNLQTFAVVMLASGIFIFLIGALGVAWNSSSALDTKYLKDKIAMYEEENTSIEKDIDAIVANYMEHESITYDKSEVESSTVLVQMYPDLKSNELVQSQMKIYNDNNKKIKSLKTKLIESNKARWLIYFGGN